MAESRNRRWQRATVVEAVDVADRIKRIVLAPEHPRKVRAGEHIDLELELNGRTEMRSYSLVEANDDGSRLAITVFHTLHSRGGSEYMHTLGVGDVLRITAPLQDFPLRVGAPQYVLLAGGIGITAILGMARVLKAVRADYRVIYVGRSRSAMAYLDQVREEHGDRARIYVDDEGTSLDAASVVAELAPGTELYMCGPIRLMDAVRRAWIERDLEISDLRFETFGSSGWFDPEEFEVEIPRLGVNTTVGRDESLLEALERAGVEMMFDCRKGECGLCQVTVQEIRGEVDHRDVFFSEAQKSVRPAAKLCSCVSRVATEQTDDAAAASGTVSSSSPVETTHAVPRLRIDVS